MLKAFVDRVDICYQDKVVATHRRLLGKGEESLSIFHYLPLLIKKPGAFDNAKPVRSWQAPPLYQKVLDILQKRYPGARGKREFLKILGLQEDGNQDKLEEAMRRAVKLDALNFDTVRNILEGLDNHIERVPDVDLGSYPHLAGYQIGTKDLSQYNLLSRRFQ